MTESKQISLISSKSRVEIPFIKVVIGDYILGVYDKNRSSAQQLSMANIRFPNYVQSLEITKINGQVNQYTLGLVYGITPDSDPNFIEKIISSVSDTRKIVFSYGDLSAPTYIYRDEEAIITKVSSNFNIAASQIQYTIQAISASTMLNGGSFTFQKRTAQPSSVLYELLTNKMYGLQDIFYGMRDLGKVQMEGLIARDDKIVDISMKTNISILDYMRYLVSCMTPAGDLKNKIKKNGIYVLNVVDDRSGKFQGPYFTVKKLSSNIQAGNNLDTYSIDIGYPGDDIVTNFSVDSDENYSIYYDYTSKITQEEYQYRINNKGELEPVYAPLISSNNQSHKTTEADRSWWTSVTEYPISATLEIKGLLRPSLLMQYLNLNIYYYGRKHIDSGLYVITKQVDRVDLYGFRTQLSLLRISGNDYKDNNLSSGSTSDLKDSVLNNNRRQIPDTSVR